MLKHRTNWVMLCKWDACDGQGFWGRLPFLSFLVGHHFLEKKEHGISQEKPVTSESWFFCSFPLQHCISNHFADIFRPRGWKWSGLYRVKLPPSLSLCWIVPPPPPTASLSNDSHALITWSSVALTLMSALVLASTTENKLWWSSNKLRRTKQNIDQLEATDKTKW